MSAVKWGNMSRSTVHRTLQENDMYPYKYVWAQDLDRPRAAQVRWSINLWAGICGDFVVGPYILPNRLDGPLYKIFVEHVLPTLLEEIPLETRKNMYLQHDGAPAHYAADVRSYLDEAFQDRCIGRRGAIAWPARSPDLNPLDFFFWEYLKKEVYRVEVSSPEEAIARIHGAVACITPDMLRVYKLTPKKECGRASRWVGGISNPSFESTSGSDRSLSEPNKDERIKMRRMGEPNTLGEQVERERWSRRNTLLQRISATTLTDFPKLTQDHLLLLTSGPYQIDLAQSYLAELMEADTNNVSMMFIKETPNIIRLEIKSRHVNAKTYRLYIDYELKMDQIEGIRRYWCECPNGNRTVGCCSHVAAAIFYLVHARYLPQILRPAAQLTELFVPSREETEAEGSESEA
nr:PREDICTED: uncharacterized protein LOC105664076 [Megachile rotundata]